MRMRNGDNMVYNRRMGLIVIADVGHGVAKAFFTFLFFVTTNIQRVQILEIAIQLRHTTSTPMPLTFGPCPRTVLRSCP